MLLYLMNIAEKNTNTMSTVAVFEIDESFLQCISFAAMMWCCLIATCDRDVRTYYCATPWYDVYCNVVMI